MPLLLVIVWFGLGGYGGPLFGKLESISSNDEASFLPRSAESTKVQEIQKRFVGQQTLPAIIVFESEDQISPAVTLDLVNLAGKLSQVDGVKKSEPGAPSSVLGPIPAADGKAAQLIVPISAIDNIAGVVGEMRQQVKSNTPAGVKAYVAGPGGYLADLTGAFGGIDGLLLLVALGAVLVILIVVYRSLLLPFLVLLTAIFALCAAIIVIYLLGKAGVITLNGQSQGILSILVIGAATDYALLMVARFREALHHTASRFDAIKIAWKASFEPVTASAATVAAALLCLLFSDLGSNKSLGPVGAVGIVAAWLAAMSFLPALLTLFGRAAFWPVTPKRIDSSKSSDPITSFWQKVGRLIESRPSQTWFVTLLLLLIAAAAVPTFKASGVPETELLLRASEAIDGQKALSRHYDAGSGTPVVIIAPATQANLAGIAAAGTEGIAEVELYKGFPGSQAVEKDGQVIINATLDDPADSNAARETVERLRTNLKAVDPGILVGGRTAVAVDTNRTAQHDLKLIIPVVLIVILVILMILLRAIVAPLLLIGTVVVSYLATIGVSALVFNHLLGHPGADPTVPLFGFVFLVALGVDYNIFLMTRVREETVHHGTRSGIIQGLGRTGGVITSAGIVLASTFAALGVIPILFLLQLAFIVAFGVLLDTILVRTLLLPALCYDLGNVIWWPSKLARRIVVPSKHN